MFRHSFSYFSLLQAAVAGGSIARHRKRHLLCASSNQNSEMPTDVVSAACRPAPEHFVPGFSKKTCATEVKSGFLVLLGPGGIRQDVRVVVYRTTLEHFAVMYPRKRLSKPLGVVNLRNTTTERVDATCGFSVRQKDYDNAVSAKFLCSERDIEAWLCAFSPRRCPPAQHAASLPVLVEAEES